MKVGVLALQGGVIEHINQIEALGHQAMLVKKEEDLEKIDKIILPGGESTTIGKLLAITGLLEPLKKKVIKGLPVWGTCAGMILFAKEIENDSRRHLELMDIKVKRNAFGTQINSFKTSMIIEEVSKEELELVFIRAPYIEQVSENVKTLCKVEGKIVAARQNNMLVTSFHPELTNNCKFLKYFLEKF